MAETRYLIGGGLGAAVVPLLVFGLHLPFLFAVIAGAAVFGGTLMLLKPKDMFEDINLSKIEAGQLAAARAVLNQAYPDIEEIGVAAKQIEDKTIRNALQSLAAKAKQAADLIEADPERLSTVRRLLTYYVPRTRDIATSFAQITAKSTAPNDQIARVHSALQQLDDAYSHYRQQSVADKTRELDAEIDLLSRSIKQDLEKL